MIYSIHWSSIISSELVSAWNIENYPGKKVGDIGSTGDGKALADAIKASKNDTFLFLLSNYAGDQARYQSDQKPTFDQWVKRYELEKYVKYQSAGISNPAHQERKYSVYFIVIQSEEHDNPVELKGMVNA